MKRILSLAHQDDVEQSRIYGKIYVSPIKVGEFPPVCVTEHITGPDLARGFMAMRDPKRPLVLVFCKDVKLEAAGLYSALDSLTAYGELPCYIIVTDRKGIAPAEGKGFDPKYYYTASEGQKRIEALKQQAAHVGLSEPSLDIAINRFWQDSLSGTQKTRTSWSPMFVARSFSSNSLAQARSHQSKCVHCSSVLEKATAPQAWYRSK